jgi:hypothetical protein
VNEHELQAAVLRLCDRLQLKVLALPDSKRITHGRGWPDLTIAGPREVMFAELKSAGGQLSKEQRVLKYALEATGHYYAVWRPLDLQRGHIEIELRRVAG